MKNRTTWATLLPLQVTLLPASSNDILKMLKMLTKNIDKKALISKSKLYISKISGSVEMWAYDTLEHLECNRFFHSYFV